MPPFLPSGRIALYNAEADLRINRVIVWTSVDTASNSLLQLKYSVVQKVKGDMLGIQFVMKTHLLRQASKLMLL